MWQYTEGPKKSAGKTSQEETKAKEFTVCVCVSLLCVFMRKRENKISHCLNVIIFHMQLQTAG